jgi:hypothetical protein
MSSLESTIVGRRLVSRAGIEEREEELREVFRTGDEPGWELSARLEGVGHETSKSVTCVDFGR